MDRRDELRELELQRRSAQRLQREAQEEQQRQADEARRVEEERQRFLQDEQRKLQEAEQRRLVAEEKAEAEQKGEEEAEKLAEAEKEAEAERQRQAFWDRQKAKNADEARKRQERKLERERQEQEEQERQKADEERKRQQEEEKRRQDAIESAKGFGDFAAESVYRPKGFKDQQKLKGNGGFDADLPRGFGSFGKEDKPPEGVAGAKAGGGAFGNQASGGGAAASGAPPFRGKPFAPRDIRAAAGANDVKTLTDYVEQRPQWVDKQDKNGWSALMFSIKSGHTAAVEALLQANADVNGRTKDGLTPLAFAVQKGGENHPIANLLRNNGAEL